MAFTSFDQKMSSMEYLLFIIFGIFSIIMLRSAIYSHIQLYIERGANQFTIEDVWVRIKKNLLIILGSSIFLFILLPAATLIFAIPGIYLGVPLSMLFMVILIEKKSITDSFNRCFELVKNQWWATFGILVIMIIILTFIGYYGYLVPQVIIGMIMGLSVLDNQNEIMKLLMIIFSSISLILIFLMPGITMLTSAVQYFSLIEKKECPVLFARIKAIAESDENEEQIIDF